MFGALLVIIPRDKRKTYEAGKFFMVVFAQVAIEPAASGTPSYFCETCARPPVRC